MATDLKKLEAQLAQLQAENAALKETRHAARPFSLKVSDKGAVSVYGLGRFPVTLYKTQWEMLISRIEEVKTFIKVNESKLSVKA